MIAGRLKYRLQLLEPVTAASVSGEYRGGYKHAGWAYAERVRFSGRRVTEAGALFADYTVHWRIRDAHRVAEGWRVCQCGGHTYSVAAIEPNRDRGYLTLICERLND